jgi:hypothetical protein
VLQILSLANCLIGNTGIKSLANGLKYNRSLIDLNLKNNRLTDIDVIKSLVRSLPRYITHLDLSENELKDEGVEVFAKAYYQERPKSSIHDGLSSDDDDAFSPS